MLVIPIAVLVVVLFLLPYIVARLTAIACLVGLLIFYPLIFLLTIALLLGAFFLCMHFK